MQITQNKRFEVLDSFRGIAAICVVIFHMHLVGSITELEFFRGSFLFVEFFFVLSGFVLAHSYGFKAVSFRNFFISRTFRLFPLHIAMLLIFILLEFSKLIAYKYGFTFNNIPFTNSADPQEIVPNLLLLQSWLPFTETLSFNAPSWSISVEYYMYMIFFSLLATNSKTKLIFWSIISLVSFCSIAININFGSEIIRGLSCFFAGAIIYVLYSKTQQKVGLFNRNYFYILEVFLILFTVWLISSDFEHKSIYASLLFCLNVYIFSFEKGIISIYLKKNFFLYLGKLSYSIYMVHMAILFCTISAFMVMQKILNLNLAPMIEDERYLDIGNPILNNAVIFVVICMIIFVAHFTHQYIEVKGREFGKRYIKK